MLGLIASLFFASCGDNDTNNPDDPDNPQTSTSQKRLTGVTFSCELYNNSQNYHYVLTFNNLNMTPMEELETYILKEKEKETDTMKTAMWKNKSTHK